MRQFGLIFTRRQHTAIFAMAAALLMPAFYSCNTGKDEPKMPTPDEGTEKDAKFGIFPLKRLK